jgi:hypothetical protein
MAKVDMTVEEQELFTAFRKQQELKANIESTKEEIKDEWNELKEKGESVKKIDPLWRAPWVLEVGADPQRYVRPVVAYLERKKEATEGEIIGSFTDATVAKKVRTMLENWRTQKLDEKTGVPVTDKGKPVFPRSPCLYDPQTGSWKLKPKQ